MTTGAIEDKIIERIIAAVPGFGYKLDAKTYGGEISDGIDRAIKNFPAVLVVFNGRDKDRVRSTRNNAIWTYRWMLICCATSLRNEASARKGSETGVGSYQIADDLEYLFHEAALGLDYIEPVKPVGVRPLINDRVDQQLASVYGLDIEIVVHRDHAPDLDADDVGDFQTFHANWDIPTFGNVGPEVPDDENADATDNVTLPIEGQ